MVGEKDSEVTVGYLRNIKVSYTVHQGGQVHTSARQSLRAIDKSRVSWFCLCLHHFPPTHALTHPSANSSVKYRLRGLHKVGRA